MLLKESANLVSALCSKAHLEVSKGFPKEFPKCSYKGRLGLRGSLWRSMGIVWGSQGVLARDLVVPRSVLRRVIGGDLGWYVEVY